MNNVRFKITTLFFGSVVFLTVLQAHSEIGCQSLFELTKTQIEKSVQSNNKTLSPNIQKSQKLVADAQNRMAMLFSTTSGFSNIEDYIKTMKTGPDLGAKLVREIESNQLGEIAIYRTESRRVQIMNSGLLNQHTTGSSKASEFDIALRNQAEAAMLGISLQEYELLPSEVKPKSALLQPTLEQNYERQGDLMYGKDAYILKEEILADRLTWTPEDSLNRFVVANQMNHEDKTIKNKLNKWDHFFIPWSYRSLMIPYLLPNIILWNRFVPEGNPYFFVGENINLYPHFKKLQDETPQKILNIDKEWAANNQNYIELQIWGPVNLDHVKAFQFSENPPTGEFLHELLQRGIEIRDARGLNPNTNTGMTSRKPKIWKP